MGTKQIFSVLHVFHKKKKLFLETRTKQSPPNITGSHGGLTTLLVLEGKPLILSSHRLGQIKAQLGHLNMIA